MKNVAVFFASTLAPLVMAFAVWWASLGYYQNAEHWVAETLIVKEQRAARITEPKLIIVAGSNALFGIDSENLSSLIGRPVVNLATHAGLPLEFHVEEALKFANRGDIVLMPLEFQYYDSAPELTSWQVANLSSWGYRFVKEQFARAVRYFRYTSVWDVYERLHWKPLPIDPVEVITATTKANSEAALPRWVGYSYRSMTDTGEFISGEGAPIQTNIRYTTGTSSAFSLVQLKALREKLAARGASLRFTLPVTMKNPEFDLDLDRSAVERLKQALDSAGLELICDPHTSQFERRLFLNTEYHLGAEGTQLRTAAIASCLNGVAFDRELGERLYRQRVAQAERSGVENRNATLADLNLVISALQKYKAENGHYPIRPSWDGFSSSHGPSTDWIPDLVPKYIPALPRDRRMHNQTEGQYLYRSDGVDFKLLAHGRPDCEKFRSMQPDLIDPKRDCIAVGFWSDGARGW